MVDKAKNGDTVKVHYVGKLTDGTVFDSSLSRSPLEFTIGDGNLISGFEKAVIGMVPGETKTEHIPPPEGYGEYRNDLIIDVDRSAIPDGMEVAVGQELLIKQPDGYVVQVTVKGLNDNSVTLDANHPLAGKELVFDINLVEIE